MSAMQGTLNAVERSMRCVFVGNIPYEATEEQLKAIFSEVGHVISFRFFYDNDTEKPKGYGFCEYKDHEMAISAVRNLNGYELKGRALRVDIAGSEKSREELENLDGCLGDSHGTSYGVESTQEKAPEEISKAVASLPAEQMFELMKQMKMCIENNPHEARNLLLQNPQLAYALLQAQVIMRIVDPEVAVKILNRPTVAPAAGSDAIPDAKPNVESAPSMLPPMSETSPFAPVSMPSGIVPVTGINPAASGPRLAVNPLMRNTLLGDRPSAIAPSIPVQFSDRDLRSMGDLDLRQLPLMDRDMRIPQILLGDKDMRQLPLGDQDFRVGIPQNVPENRPFDPRFRSMQASDISKSGSVFDRSRPAVNIDPRTAYEARTVAAPPRVEDPRKAPTVSASATHIHSTARLSASAALPNIPPNLPNAISSARQLPAAIAAANASAAILAPHDQEKAALIMQVLQLSDQQIALLPMEQRQSIMVLKEQIARSQI